MNTGLLVLRVLLALILLAHSVQKSKGWLQGPGLTASADIFESLGHRPGRVMVRVAALCELLAGLSLLFGFLTPLGAAVAAGTLLVAGASQNARSGKLWNALGGGEYALALAVIAVALGFCGAGEWSADRVLFGPFPAYTGWLALVVAVLAAIPPSVRSRRNLRHASASPAG